MYNKINVQRHQEERECPNCGKTWSIWTQRFYPKSFRYKCFCKECHSILTPWEKKSVKMQRFPEERQRYLLQKRQEFLRSHTKHMLNQAKLRAGRKGLGFNLLESDIIIPDKCPILEVSLVIGTKDNYEYSPSLDRKDNSRGYTKDNVWVISKKANSMKNSATSEELECFCKNVLRYSLNNREKEPIEQEDKEPLG